MNRLIGCIVVISCLCSTILYDSHLFLLSNEGVVGFTHATAPVRGWEGLIGGAKCPKDKFPYPLQLAPTPKNKQGGGMMSYAQKHLMLNFCLDVAGYGRYCIHYLPC